MVDDLQKLSFFKQTKVGIIAVDSSDRILSINPAALEILGLDTERLKLGALYFKDLELIDEEDNKYSQVSSLYSTVTKKTGYNNTILCTAHKKSQEMLWLDMEIIPQNDSEVETGYFVSFNDITSRKGYESELVESIEVNRAMLQNARTGIGFYDTNGRVVFYNDLALSHMGGTLEDFIGKSFTELYGEDVGKEYFKRLNKAIESNERIVYEDKLELAGRTQWFSSEYSVIRASDGVTHGVMIISTDITDLKESLHDLRIAKEKVEESEEKFKTIFNMSQSLICIADINTSTFKYLNPAFEHVLGYSNEELLSKSFLEFIHPDDVKSTQDVVEKKLQAGIAVLTFENRYLCKNGDCRWLNWNLFPVPEKGITYAIAHDVTELKKSEKELQDKNEEYEAINEELRQTNEELIIAKERAEENKIKLDEIKQTYDYATHIGKVGTWDWNLVTDGLIWSSETYRILGYKPFSVTPSYNLFLDIVHPEDRKNLDDNVKAAWYEKRPFSVDCRVILSNNTIRICNATGKVEYDDSGNPIRMIGTFQDITERKKMESELIEAKERAEVSEAEFKAAYYTSPDAVNINKLDGEYVEINEGFTRLTGFNEEDVIGKLSSEIDIWSIPEDRAKLVEGLKKHGLVENLESLFRAKDGRLIPALISARLFEINNEPHILSVTRAITERKKMEQELREAKEKAEENENKLIEAQELSHVGSWEYIINSDKVIWSKELYNIYERSHELPAPKYSEQVPFYTKESFAKLDKALKDCVRNEIPYEIELDIITSSGSVKQIISKGNAIKDANNRIIGSYGTAQDITEQKKMEQELIKAKEKAEESDRLKTAFLQNMSHEIRTPMNGILGFTRLLKDNDITNEEKVEFLEQIEISGKRMLNLLNDIISISKIETGQLEINKTYFRLNEQLRVLYHAFEKDAKEKNLEFILNDPFKDASIEVYTDLNKFITLLNKLLSNAIKFTKEGRVSFGYEINNKDFTFYISDTGVGIPREFHDKIFQRFVQVDDKLTRGYEGAGLGLSLTKSFVELLGGKMWLESEKNIGTSIYFVIPELINEKIEDVSGVENISKEDALFEKRNILIAEDDDASSYLLEKYLNKDFLNLIRTRTGKETLKFMQENDCIDLILMDIKMPEMDGLTVTKEIRKFNKDVPIIAQTASAFMEDMKEALSAGCNEYISKPYDRENLLTLVRKYFK